MTSKKRRKGLTMAGETSYRVVWLRKAIDVLKDMGRKAREAGRGKELAQIIRAFDQRLRREPLNVGEVYRARGAVAEHLAVQEFIAVDFAVDQARRFVLVRKCHALSGHGL